MPYENVQFKGVADIVFVVDLSRSMSDIIRGLKDYIADFVHNLLTDPQSTVKDVRLGLVTHDVSGRPAVHAAGFTTAASDFRASLMNAPEGGTEFGLPAEDRALDFPWRSTCRRYIVFFTDEPVDGGHDPVRQNSKLQELGQKMSALHVHFIGFGPQCPSYEMLGKTPGSKYSLWDRNPTATDMKDVLEGIGKTVSQGVDDTVFANAPKNLYGL